MWSWPPKYVFMLITSVTRKYFRSCFLSSRYKVWNTQLVKKMCNIKYCMETHTILVYFSFPSMTLPYMLQLFLTLILLTWRIWWAPNNGSKWQMGFNLVFKGLIFFGTWFEVLKVGRIHNVLWIRTPYGLVHGYECLEGAIWVWVFTSCHKMEEVRPDHNFSTHKSYYTVP